VSALIFRILSWSARHRATVAAAALSLLALAALGAARLSFDTDVLTLLPRSGKAVPAFRTFVERFGSPDELYIVFRAPRGYSIADYGEQIDAWIGALRAAPEIARLDTGLADPSRDLRWLADRQLLLLREPALQAALDRLRGDGTRAAVAARRELLTLPSPEITEIVRQDPLGFYDLLRDELRGAQAGVNLGMTGAGYLSADSRSRLLIAHPARPPYDTDFSRALLARLETIRTSLATSPTEDGDGEPLPPMETAFAGGHRIAVETEALVKRESILNTVVSLALILPLLFLVFRSLWLVLVGPLPAALALAIVLGVAGVAGTTLSAAATASAAMLFGLGIDGVVLLYVAHMRTRRADTESRALTGPATSMLLGMWTTAATFYGLALVDFPSLQQLGTLIGHGMLLCGILTLVMVPALLPRRATPDDRRISMPGLAAWIERRRGRILWIALVATVVLGAAATRVRVNPTLDRLRSVTPGVALLDDISRQFGLFHEVYVILRRGSSLDELLAEDERLAARIERALPGVAVQRASALLPSSSAQTTRRAAIAGAVESPRAAAAILERAATAEGFRPGSFQPFEDRLPQLLAGDQNVTYDGYVAHGLADVIGRFAAKSTEGWLLVSYAFPPTDAEAARLQQLVEEDGSGATLTGLALVNRELAERFVPQFSRGLAIGTALVLLLIAIAFHDWRLCLLSLVPTVVGLVWAAGLLAMARVELDLFAVFAVATFVGIGVDYGVHLVHRYREHGNASQAAGELAPVILIAGGITLLGYGTLVLSGYPPLRSIGVVSVAAVVTLATASVIVLPALLGSRPPQIPRSARG
jgi:predicted RND superfamily exporter protein